jgi:hypothetical protein
MNTLLIPGNALPPASEETIRKIRLVEDRIREHCFPVDIQTEHILHGGMYARTVRLAANVIVTNVIIKVPTMLVVSGSCNLLAGEEWVRLDGYYVIPTLPGRKQIVVTIEETDFTMLFPTRAKTVEEAEAQFSDEAESLYSRTQGDDLYLITGVDPCLEF